nr:hypothetical protein [Tanacetum cinerariifolium]
MAKLSEDIQSAGSDTRPLMLDRSDFESWQQRIRLYCKEQDNGENILKSIDEGPFKMGKFTKTLAEGALHLGPERDRVVSDLTPEEKDRLNRVQGNNARGAVTARNGGVQNRVDNTFLVKQSLLNYFKDKMLLMQAQENGVVLDEEHLLFLTGGQANTFDANMTQVQDLTFNADNVFQADQCDAFDFDVDDDPIAQTMFMENLSTTVHHEAHEMQNDVQLNYVVDSDAEYTSDCNIITYDQYVKNNTDQVVQSDVSSVPNEALMMIINDMHKQATQCLLANNQNKVVNESLTAELVRYNKQVELYEKRAMFELTEREQKIDEQMRIIINECNILEESLKKELHSVTMQLNSNINHDKLMKEEVATLKTDFK